MRVLFDKNVAYPIKRFLADHTVSTVEDEVGALYRTGCCFKQLSSGSMFWSPATKTSSTSRTWRDGGWPLL